LASNEINDEDIKPFCMIEIPHVRNIRPDSMILEKETKNDI
jgi:hypothetical protein